MPDGPTGLLLLIVLLIRNPHEQIKNNLKN